MLFYTKPRGVNRTQGDTNTGHKVILTQREPGHKCNRKQSEVVALKFYTIIVPVGDFRNEGKYQNFLLNLILQNLECP